MKKTLVVAAGLAVLSTSAFATKSRMTALNQNAGQGSYYIDDERNVFRTAGAFSGNYVYMEHGSNGASGDAEGGFFREGSSMHYGLYLNSSEHGQLASAAGGAVPRPSAVPASSPACSGPTFQRSRSLFRSPPAPRLSLSSPGPMPRLP